MTYKVHNLKSLTSKN